MIGTVAGTVGTIIPTNNLAIGYPSLATNNCNAIGTNCFSNISTGNDRVAIGIGARQLIGQYAHGRNVAVGYRLQEVDFMVIISTKYSTMLSDKDMLEHLVVYNVCTNSISSMIVTTQNMFVIGNCIKIELFGTSLSYNDDYLRYIYGNYKKMLPRWLLLYKAFFVDNTTMLPVDIFMHLIHVGHIASLNFPSTKNGRGTNLFKIKYNT